MTKHEEIRDILLSRLGKDQAITAPTIADMINVEPGGSGITIRKMILETIIKFELPVASSSTGYYLLQENDEEDLKRYERSLDHRKYEIDTRRVLIRYFFNKHYNKGELELTGDIFDDDDDAGDNLDI